MSAVSQSIKTQLIAAFVLMAVVTAVVGVINLMQQSDLSDRASAMALRDLDPLTDLHAAELALANLSTLDILAADPRTTEAE
ncbi:MAG: MCP four helix bundle domain-containing protein [Micromonosporaceae bacterium]|nr:MCP four helix bundle domain-containing protein [Micromonosporaceae bacterium]